MQDTRATIEIAWVSDLSAAAGPLARVLPDAASAVSPLAPSSLQSGDPAVAAIRPALRERGIRTTVLLPRSPAALLAPGRGSAWHAATIDGRRWRIDARLARSPWSAIAVIDAGHHTGPFALDLPTRFLHPADRVRLATRPDRLRMLADIAAIAPPVACLAVSPAGGGWLAVATRDPIAAELWALALAERFHPADIEMQGPWEEPAVQRATELGLGIRIPGDMHIAQDIPTDAPAAQSLLDRISERLGLPPVSNQTTG
jgi:hypothetical protein